MEELKLWVAVTAQKLGANILEHRVGSCLSNFPRVGIKDTLKSMEHEN
jgi:hypothetical protein